ncbi:MAG: DUF4384 domain-containing protein [Prevotellaceae bacterium]|jgi:hypothetical protein|nr:DUF4384 domain-containing protein [Prevotellaceae bacterium]
MTRYFLILLLLAQGTWLGAQYRDIAVEGAQGAWPASNITPEEAAEKALTEAKIAALRKAGVAENVTSIATLFSDNSGQAYAEVSKNETRGTIIHFTVRERQPEVMTDESGASLMQIRVTIDATVRIYETGADPRFAIKIGGIKASYAEHELLSFSITPSGDGYLKIFVFEYDQSGALLFPNEAEPGRLLKAGRQVDFPTTRGITYRLAKIDPLSAVEANRMIIVYTKDEVPYMEPQMDFHSVLNWLARISPDRQTTGFVQYSITKKEWL